MKIRILAIGKIKENYFAEAIAEYVKRCSRYCDVIIAELPEAPKGKTAEEQSRIESARLMEKAKGYVVAMDPAGELISSEGLASLIRTKGAEAGRDISVLIGGSHGHSEELKRSADAVISFGKITLPHQLFRVVVCEQIYRALTINAGVPYHK